MWRYWYLTTNIAVLWIFKKPGIWKGSLLVKNIEICMAACFLLVSDHLEFIWKFFFQQLFFQKLILNYWGLLYMHNDESLCLCLGVCECVCVSVCDIRYKQCDVNCALVLNWPWRAVNINGARGGAGGRGWRRKGNWRGWIVLWSNLMS